MRNPYDTDSRMSVIMATVRHAALDRDATPDDLLRVGSLIRNMAHREGIRPAREAASRIAERVLSGEPLHEVIAHA